MRNQCLRETIAGGKCCCRLGTNDLVRQSVNPKDTDAIRGLRPLHIGRETGKEYPCIPLQA